MTPDLLFAADERRQIATSRALRSLLGENVRQLTPAEAEAALANHVHERRDGIRSDGYCQVCGAIVGIREHYCTTCRTEKRRETYRESDRRRRGVA
jgi:hypothetical protein